ncbi:LysR family transcriptional regulator [Plastoroseomonas hellenica]|uniref:LysR family transcriptional regulator n=1 Tax=Plastoroseomonas hellenica TaxID=2687306 RepID=UPI001BA59C0B|nr:LysR family transcriptional regulator [Plastoroseomonas hellenica]MBR0641847.1 LysR family transcriptional regulator [Plastoroseomonas hellenica]
MAVRGFDWDNLRFFLELARQGRLAPAARRLRVDSATVSRRVSELERQFDTKLFDRTDGGFALTDAGRRLLPQAEGMQQLAEEAGDLRPERLAGRVRVATMEGIASQYLSRLLPGLRARHPALLVELVTSAALINLTKREADISLSFVPPRGPKLSIRQIGAFALFLYAAPAYLAARGTPADAAALATHDFVDYVEDLVQIPEVHWLLDVVLEPNVVFRSSSMFAQQTAAACGAGLVLLPSFAGARDARLVPVLADQLQTERPIWLSVHEELAEMPRVRAVAAHIEAAVRADATNLLRPRWPAA